MGNILKQNSPPPHGTGTLPEVMRNDDKIYSVFDNFSIQKLQFDNGTVPCIGFQINKSNMSPRPTKLIHTV